MKCPIDFGALRMLNEREGTAALQREFDAHRKAHSMGDELAELGATVKALYEKMK